MKKIFIMMFSVILFLGMIGLAQANLTSSIQVSGTGFLYGDTATVSVSLNNNGLQDVPVNAYIARWTSDGAWTMYSLLQQGFVPFDPLTPSTWKALVANFVLPTGVSIVNVPLLYENFIGGMPAGSYRYFFILTPGLSADPLNTIITFSQASCTLFATGSQGPTYHSGTITENETWTLMGNPHIIKGTLTVAGSAPNGATLTIQPGVIVEFEENAAIEIGESNSPGTLSAVGTGTSGGSIVFTSNQLVNSKGWWQHIKFNEQAVNSRMEFCDIEYGGSIDSWYSGASVVIAGTQGVVVKNCTIKNNKLSGIRIIDETGLGTIQANVIKDNDGYGIKLYADQVRGVSEDNQVAGNTLGGVYVLEDKVEHDATWHKLDTPYIVDQVTVSSTAGSVLTIDPGVVLAFTQDGYLNIGDDSEPGKLVASGTKAEPITFTSNQRFKTTGWWRHVKFEAEAVESALNHCIIEYGGSIDSWYSNASVVVGSSNGIDVTNCEIKKSNLHGLKVMDGANPDITGTSFSDNTLEDILIYDENSTYHGTPVGSPSVKSPL